MDGPAYNPDNLMAQIEKQNRREGEKDLQIMRHGRGGRDDARRKIAAPDPDQ